MVGRHARPLLSFSSLGAIVLVMTSVVLGETVGAARARTTAIGCGTTVVTSIVLERDLIDCPADGLIVGADDITIDLNGHTIDGPGTFDFGWDGIDNGAGHDRVTIVNGTLQDFDRSGVYLDGTTGVRLADLVLTDDSVGVRISSSSDVSIQTSTIVGNRAAGITLQGSTGTVIENNVISNSRASDEILLFYATGTLIRGNRIRGGIGAAILSVLGSDTDVIGNVLAGGGTNAVGVYMDTPGGRIARNEISGFEFIAVLVGQDRVRVQRNAVHHSPRGIQVQGSYFGRPTGVVVRRNEVFRADVGILVREVTDILVERNVTHDDRLGIVVRNSTGTVLLKNRSDHNADDGIQIHDPATTVTHNRADLNGDLGIEAVEGVTDGGGNRARGNGDPAQCLNVDCLTGGG